MIPERSRLALGTVQFGQSYGVANRTGQVDVAAVAGILLQAWHSGVDTLDTAIAYGTAEDCLGDVGVRQWRVVTKLPPVPQDIEDLAEWVGASVAGSLERLGVDQLYGLLLHKPDDLLGPHGAVLDGALRRLKTQRIVHNLGVSVQDPSQLDVLWPRFELDLVQAPFNVIDRRLASSGWLTKLKRAGIEVHVRSAFLQGLLLMPAKARPTWFDRWAPLWIAWDRWLRDRELTPLQGCLGFVMSAPEVDRVVVGVDSRVHLDEIVQAQHTRVQSPPLALSSEDPDLVDPPRWRLA